MGGVSKVCPELEINLKKKLTFAKIFTVAMDFSKRKIVSVIFYVTLISLATTLLC